MPIKYIHDYESFDSNLEMDFIDMDIYSKQQLSTLMRENKYHVVKAKDGRKYKDNPTDKQLEYAWFSLRKKYGILLRENKEYIILANRHYVWQSLKEVYINNKRYIKGMFLPHKRSE